MKGSIFGVDKSMIEGQINQDKLVNLAIGLVAVAATLTPLVVPKFMDRESKLLTLLLGTVSSAGLCVNLKLGERKGKIYKVFDDAQVQELTEELAYEKTYHQADRKIEGMRRMATTVAQAPEYEQPRWIETFGLHGLIPPTVEELTQPETPGEPQQSWLTNPTTTESVAYIEPTPDNQWILDLAEKSCLPLAQRSNQHWKIDGGSQSGKSTFVSLLIILITKLSGEVITNLIDPKYPMSDWHIKPSFTGYDGVIPGVQMAIRELDDRKQRATEAKKKGEPLPEFKRYLLILDEWDTVWGNGKGFGDIIDNKQAVRVKNDIQRFFKEAASYNITLILIGQSPLSTDNGFSRSSFSSATRVVLGNEALKWTQDPGFVFKNSAKVLSDELEDVIETGSRVALVVPNIGSKPFVKAIPPIDIKAIVGGEKPQEKDYTKPFTVLREWYTDQEPKPDDATISKAWETLTKEKLTEDGLKYLLSKLRDA